MDPASSSTGFNMLGMNIGGTESDYRMLHKRVRLYEGETFEDVLSEYERLTGLIDNFEEEAGLEPLLELKRDREPVEERLFYLLSNQRNPIHIDSHDEVLANLLFTKGWDILEQQIEKPLFQELINQNSGMLCDRLSERVKDKQGAEQIKQHYPKLYKHMTENFNSDLPKLLKKTIWQKFKGLFHRRVPPVQVGYEQSALGKQLQGLKDRLAENFFRKVVSSADRPGVISLQEVGRQNDHVLGILENANYKVFRSGDGDTAIALDVDRFSYQFFERASQRSATVYAQDKKTGENFIFISVHIPGFKLEFPSAQQTLETHLGNVEGYLMSSYDEVKQINEVIRGLKASYPDAKIIVQGDFNASPEYFEDPRLTEAIRDLNLFKPFQDNGLDVERTGQPTEHYTPVWEVKLEEADPEPLRELDYVVADNSLHGRVKFLSIEDQELTLADSDHYDPMLLFSDHRPIWTRISSEAEEESQ